MKNDGVSANIADNHHRAMSGVSEHSATELASALAMMHATLESTTDAILVTDEANYVREFNEKYVNFWGIPPHMMISAHASELWNYVSPQLKDPVGYLARVHEIIASAAPETFDVLQLKDGRFRAEFGDSTYQATQCWPCMELPVRRTRLPTRKECWKKSHPARRSRRCSMSWCVVLRRNRVTE
jgi:PAS domain-containing protein